ncbi:hypothetical protein BAY61_04485 [Prauserella marina]|nr:hypothetical protein BAY61_04485 [Prauserella marina]
MRAWEEAYGQYTSASERASAKTDGITAQAMASASWAVARAWRSIASAKGLPWWSVAASETAAQAFEEQATHWERVSRNLGIGEGADGRPLRSRGLHFGGRR